MRERTAITFETVQNTTDYGGGNKYYFTSVVIRSMYRVDSRKALEATVDNKAGYGTEDACRKQGVLFQDLLNLGYAEHFDVCTFADLDIHIQYQHYYPQDGGAMGYCDPRFEDMGKGYRQMGVGMKFLGRLGRGVERLRLREALADSERAYDPSLRDVSNNSFACPERVLRALRAMRDAVEISRLPGRHVWVRSSQIQSDEQAA